jgi:hypothetical protein
MNTEFEIWWEEKSGHAEMVDSFRNIDQARNQRDWFSGDTEVDYFIVKVTRERVC